MSLLDSAVAAGSLASLGAGLATGIGALPILGLGRLRPLHEDLMLGFAAGVMLAASFFSLIIPALGVLEARHVAPLGASAVVATGVLLGALFLATLDRIAPPLERFGLGDAVIDPRARGIWFLIVAITLHNLPEGMAVGVSFAGGDYASGATTALGIGIQNIPEGLAVAGALASLGYGRGRAVLGSLASGLVEPLAGTAGAALVSVALPLLPWGLCIAAGAMIHIIITQIVPETYRRSGGGMLTAAFMAGLTLMMFLDTALG